MVLIQEFEFGDLSIGVCMVFYAFSEDFLHGSPFVEESLLPAESEHLNSNLLLSC